MYCTKCNAELNDNAKFCIKCGAPTNNAQAQTEPAPAPKPAPAPMPAPAPQAAPVSKADSPAKKKRNPLKVIIPIIVGLVVLGIGAAVFVFVCMDQKPEPTVSDFRKALKAGEYDTALELCEQLPEEECEKVLEQYIIDVLNSDSDDISEAEDKINELFDEGFDSFEDIYDNYENGSYLPAEPTVEVSEQPESSTAQTEQATAGSDEQPEQTMPQTEQSVPPVESEQIEEPQPSLSERLVGSWSKKLAANCYEYVVFLKDGTGYIYSDIVSEKRSDTNSSYLYYDGRIHFNWVASGSKVFVDAEFDPYCFVAYQGYSAPNHSSNATWQGEAKGSHNYYFSYDTKDEYLCDMLSISSVDKLNKYDCITRDYWNKHISVSDAAWDTYFYHNDEMNYDAYSIDYKALPDIYYSSSALCAKYEDIDLYHFVLFTEMVLRASGNPTTITLDFNMEDYERVE